MELDAGVKRRESDGEVEVGISLIKRDIIHLGKDEFQPFACLAPRIRDPSLLIFLQIFEYLD